MKPRIPKITHKRLLELLDYNPEIGLFRWRQQRSWRAPVGSVAGVVDRHGHRTMMVDQERFMAHRLAWFYVYQEWPPNEIDHINGLRDDNRILNLRLAVRWQQRGNQKRRADNRSGFKGVKRAGKNSWIARCRIHGKEYTKCGFRSPEDAHVAYLEMAKSIFGDYARAE